MAFTFFSIQNPYNLSPLNSNFHICVYIMAAPAMQAEQAQVAHKTEVGQQEKVEQVDIPEPAQQEQPPQQEEQAEEANGADEAHQAEEARFAEQADAIFPPSSLENLILFPPEYDNLQPICSYTLIVQPDPQVLNLLFMLRPL